MIPVEALQGGRIRTARKVPMGRRASRTASGKVAELQPTAARPIGKLRHVGAAVSVGNDSVAILASSSSGTLKPTLLSQTPLF